MERALEAHRKTGANYQSSYNQSYLALAHARAGDIERALEISAQAVDEVERSGERWWEAEAHRLKGEICLMAVPALRDEAEVCFRRALECARLKHAKLWELHAAQSLAKLWSTENRHERTRDLLAAVYGQFTEGFDLPALKEAKELLDRLSDPTRVL